ncbi:hypothetical protein BGZ83_006272 [Gryganskiella cystojenkinii]|nr:hypothetical protein BGZ83_006272 [Gryganskiella cystojenkinii]
MTLEIRDQSWIVSGGGTRLRINKSVVLFILAATLGLVHLRNLGLLPFSLPILHQHHDNEMSVPPPPPPPSPMEVRLTQLLQEQQVHILQRLDQMSDQSADTLSKVTLAVSNSEAASFKSTSVNDQLGAVIASLKLQQQHHELQKQHQELERQYREQQSRLQERLQHQLYLQQNRPSQTAFANRIINPKRIRIFDMIMINDELDTLELRLNELYDVVDYFYVTESVETFTKIPKPLHYKENEFRFRQFRDKIIHVVIPAMTEEDETLYRDVYKYGMWVREGFNRNKGFLLGTDAVRPNDGDWIVLADLDEIPKRAFLQELQNPDPTTEIGRRLTDGHAESDGDVIRLGCDFYYYSFEFRHHHPWNGPVLVRFRDKDSPIYQQTGTDNGDGTFKDRYPNLDKALYIAEDNWARAGQSLRDERNGNEPLHDNQCYHCTWCFAYLEQFVHKATSYSHQEHNQPYVRDPEYIKDHVRRGVDIFEREYDQFNYIENNQDLPEYIKANPEKFSYMLKRKDLPNAGFVDLPTPATPPPPVPAE